jgi:hypothetical protein
MAFHALANFQKHAIGWLQGDKVPLVVGKWYDFHEFGWHLGNVG